MGWDPGIPGLESLTGILYGCYLSLGPSKEKLRMTLEQDIFQFNNVDALNGYLFIGIRRQSLLCGRPSCMEQFTGSSS